MTATVRVHQRPGSSAGQPAVHAAADQERATKTDISGGPGEGREARGEPSLCLPDVATGQGIADLIVELRSIREDQGLSQPEVEHRALLPKTTVAKMETQGYYSTALLRNLSGYADALGYTLRYVLVRDHASPDAAARR